MKMKTLTRLLITLLAITSQWFLVNGQLTANLKQHITYLASDSLHGRMTGTEDERKAAAYIIEQFKKYGISNASGSFDVKKYSQPFEFNPTIDSVKTHISGNNVVAFINNHAKNTIIIGAH